MIRSVDRSRKLASGPVAKSSVARPAGIAARWRAQIVETIEIGIIRLSDASQPEARRIRKGRQATKVARALLRLAPSKIKRQARGLTMALGSVRQLLADTRDTDALIESLTALATDAKVSKPALNALLKPLRLRRMPLGLLQGDETAQAAGMLRKIAARVSKLPVSAEDDAHFLRAVTRDYRRFRRDARHGLDRLDVEDLHELRKRVIHHRHQIGFMARIAPQKHTERLERRASRTKALHDAIGQHRDLELLSHYLRPSRQADLRAERQRLLEEIERRQDAALKHAIPLAERLTRLKPRRLTRGVIAPAER